MAITEKELKQAQETLRKYKDGKKRLEARIKEEEKWYRLRHWDVVGGGEDANRPKPTSAWLFNAVMNKHADAMDNFPECNVLPREEGDRADAETLSDIIPVILEQCSFEDTYSANWWEKLKHGTGVYGAFWNPRKENGLGDIDIKRVDLLNIIWEPGVEDIQESRNLFVMSLVDNDQLEAEYPETRGKLGSGPADLATYDHDDTIDLSGKSPVVDWYYKTTLEGGRTVLHYVKYVGDVILFASENEESYAQRGFYDHGKYPFVFDVLFPEKGSPCGFGYVALCKDPQMYIDKLSQGILENALRAGKKRWFIGAQTGVNKEQFADWGKDFVNVEGSGNLDETHMREITTEALPASVLNILQMKIDEMKETASNRDVSSGGAASGVTAAAAIAALQEAGNKTSRDMIAASYRAYTELDYLVLELVRQFYDQERSFRITGGGADGYDFVHYSNQGIRDQEIGVDTQGNPLMRRPIFDIKIKAQKKNPFSRMSQNELAKELYGLDVFNPERAQETEGLLEMMEFEGKDRVLATVRQGATLLNQVQQLSMQVQQMAELLGLGGGAPAEQGGGTSPTPAVQPAKGNTINGAVETAMTPYMERMAKRSQVDMDTGALTQGV